MSIPTRPVALTEAELMAIWVRKNMRPNVALTFTLFKARSCEGPNGTGWERGTRERYTRAYEQFIHRVSRRVFGKAYKRHGKLLPNGLAIEGDGERKRVHLHGFLRVPDRLLGDGFARFEALCRSEWLRSPWAMEDTIIEEIAADWVGYCLKEGPEALVVETMRF